MSENPEVAESLDNICNLKSSSKEVAECMTGWLTFIQVSALLWLIVVYVNQLMMFWFTFEYYVFLKTAVFSQFYQLNFLVAYSVLSLTKLINS